jgi:hypothetical protein
MSTKTLRKRIALVAVSALGAGVLVASPANADANNTVGGANATTAAGILNIATAPSITGDAVLAANGAGSGTLSLGLLANSTTLTTSSLTSTATMRSDGEIAFYWTGSAADKALTVEVTGGTITGMTAAGDEAINMNAARNQAVVADDGASVVAAFSVSPNAGATSMTVSAYESATITAADDAAMVVQVAAIQAGTVSRGALVQRYVVTVATTSVSGAYSSAYSYVQAQESTDSALAAPTTNIDETGATTIANSASSVGYVSFDLRDAYDVSLTGKGALIVSATNGAGIALYNTTGGYGAATSVTLLSAVSNYATGTITVARPTAFANKGFSTTVTISWNGAVVGTKTIKFQGEVAKLAVTVDAVAQNGATSTGGVIGSVSYSDDAGNVLIPTSGTSAVSSSLDAVVQGVTVTHPSSILDPYGYYDVTCGGSAVTGLGGGTTNVVFQFVNPVSGSIVKSAPAAISCAGNATSISASFDKATYAPGDIATLTISGKDAAGNAANAVQDWKGSSTLFSITTPTNLTIVTAVSTTAVYFSSAPGAKTYKFIVGTTEGSFNAIIVAGNTLNSNNTSAGGAGIANVTAKYSVAAPSTGVTNADVLKAIVSLIASINKQIAALQKALLKK